MSAAALSAILIGGLWCYGRAPLLFLAMAVLLGFGFISSNIPVPIETIFGERLYYTPGFGLAFVVAALLARGHKIVRIALAVWLVASAGVCVQRTFDWRSNDTLFAADADNQPRSLGLQMNMARVCRLREDWFGRERYLERALEIDPEYTGALNDRGADLMSAGRPSDALPLFLRAVRSLEGSAFDLKTIGPDCLINVAFAQHMLELMPSLKEMRVLRQWAGLCDMTPDFAPIIGTTPVKGFIVDVGWGTYGFKAGPVAGEAVARLIAEDRVPDLIAPFALDRFDRGELMAERGAAAVGH